MPRSPNPTTLRGVSTPPPSESSPPRPLSSTPFPIFSRAESERALEIGELIGERYTFQRILAEGGMAVVVEAIHEDLAEPVAIKILKPDVVVNQELVLRFAKEVKITARVRADHAVKVIDVGTDPRRGPFMVMELLDGRDCRQILEAEGPLAERRVAEFAIQSCEALAAAHVQGIVHRDVKPDNVFVIGQNQVESVRVLDFGVSKSGAMGAVLNADVSLVKTQILVGSPAYMSPEQVRASAELGPEADIWSLGVFMYELLSGEVPFDAGGITELCAMILEQPAQPLHERNPNIDPTLSRIIMRCLEKDPAKRWANVAELAVALLPFAPRRARMAAERAVGSFAKMGIFVAPPPGGSGGYVMGSVPPPPAPAPLLRSEPPANAAATDALLLAHQRSISTVAPAPVQRKRYWLAAIPLLLLLGSVVALVAWFGRTRPEASAGVAPAPSISPSMAPQPTAAALASAAAKPSSDSTVAPDATGQAKPLAKAQAWVAAGRGQPNGSRPAATVAPTTAKSAAASSDPAPTARPGRAVILDDKGAQHTVD